MSKIRIYELAKQLNVANKDLMEKIHSVGIEAKSHMGALTDEEVAKVTALYQQKEEPKKEAPKQEAKKEAPKKDAPKQNAPRQDAPKKGGEQKQGGKNDNRQGGKPQQQNNQKQGG